MALATHVALYCASAALFWTALALLLHCAT